MNQELIFCQLMARSGKGNLNSGFVLKKGKNSWNQEMMIGTVGLLLTFLSYEFTVIYKMEQDSYQAMDIRMKEEKSSSNNRNPDISALED